MDQGVHSHFFANMEESAGFARSGHVDDGRKGMAAAAVLDHAAAHVYAFTAPNARSVPKGVVEHSEWFRSSRTCMFCKNSENRRAQGSPWGYLWHGRCAEIVVLECGGKMGVKCTE